MAKEQNSHTATPSLWHHGTTDRGIGEDLFSPAISHLACELDQQRRLRELAREARISSAVRRGGRRRFGRPARPTADFAADLAGSSEDVWKAFRF